MYGVFPPSGGFSSGMGLGGGPSTGMTSPSGMGRRRISFKRGGKVRKTGAAKLHKGERVITAKQDKKRQKHHGKRR